MPNYIDQAREEYETCAGDREIRIDDDAEWDDDTADGGCWVQAWVRIQVGPRDDEEDEEDDDDLPQDVRVHT